MHPSERFALKEFLGAQGIPVEDMVEAGLLVSGDDIPVPWDRFRDRVMFPITDLRGRVIAFGGRALEKDVPAKYMNSPETPLFHKGDNLYNLAAARLATHNGAALVVVEGYVDVIAMVGAGFPASVAPLGTALTENQLVLLWKMADEPILCFDGDKAGQKAAWRAAELALPHVGAGQESAFRAAAGRTGPRRSRALRRTRRDRGSDRAGARPRRRDLVARDRRRHLRHAGAARSTGSADQGTDQRHPRRGGAALLPPGSGGAAAAHLCAGRRPRRLMAGAISPAAAAGGFGRESGRGFAPRTTFTPGRGGPNRAARPRPRPRPAARPSTAGPTRRPARNWR